MEDRILFLAEAHGLSDLEVCEHWHQLYKGTLLSQKFPGGDSLDDAEWQALKDKLDENVLKPLLLYSVYRGCL